MPVDNKCKLLYGKTFHVDVIFRLVVPDAVHNVSVIDVSPTVATVEVSLYGNKKLQRLVEFMADNGKPLVLEVGVMKEIGDKAKFFCECYSERHPSH